MVFSSLRYKEVQVAWFCDSDETNIENTLSFTAIQYLPLLH